MVKAEDKECCKKPVFKTLRRIAACLLPLPKGANRLLPVASSNYGLDTGVSMAKNKGRYEQLNIKFMEQATLTQNNIRIGASGTNSDQLLYIGVDVHKDKHTAVALDCFGEILLEKEIDNTKKGFEQLMSVINETAKGRGLTPLFGLEDSQNYGLRLGYSLCKQGCAVKIVSPILVSGFRKYETHPEKSDLLDALGAAKVLIQRTDSLPNFSISKPQEIAKDIKEMVMDREFLIKEKTRIKNQLHRLLHRAHNTEYKEKFKNPFSVKALKYWSRYPVPKKNDNVFVNPDILKNQIRRKIKRIKEIKKDVEIIEQGLRALVDKTGQKIETMNGCGLVLAASLIAEIKDIQRFRSPSALAKYGGLCPREHSSGKKIRHIKTRAGNRRLNTTFHRIALSQIGIHGNERSKNYFNRKVAEGKSKSQALCCLKRRLVDVVFVMMKYKKEYQYPN